VRDYVAVFAGFALGKAIIVFGMSTSTLGYRLSATTGIHRGDRAYQQDQVAIFSHGRVPG